MPHAKKHKNSQTKTIEIILVSRVFNQIHRFKYGQLIYSEISRIKNMCFPHLREILVFYQTCTRKQFKYSGPAVCHTFSTQQTHSVFISQTFFVFLILYVCVCAHILKIGWNQKGRKLPFIDEMLKIFPGKTYEKTIFQTFLC